MAPDHPQVIDSLHALNASLPVVSAYEDTMLDFETLFAPSTTPPRPLSADMTFSLTRTSSGTLPMPKVITLVLFERCMTTHLTVNVVEFINENARVGSAYAIDGLDNTTSSVHTVSPREDQHSPIEGLPLDQKACYPSSPIVEDPSSLDRTDVINFVGPYEDTRLPDSSLPDTFDHSNELHQRQSRQFEQRGGDKTPELKFHTFLKKPQFDTFRPRPRSHFSSDALSMWPLRSIEESRLLQNFIQNLAAWVRPSSEAHTVLHYANGASSLTLAMAGDILQRLRRSCVPPALCSQTLSLRYQHCT